MTRSTNTVSYIYDKNLKFVIALNYSTEEMNAHHDWYSGWEDGMIISDKMLTHPKLVDGVLMEKDRVELISEGLDSLRDGEYIEKGVINTVPVPEGLLKPKWDAEAKTWSEGATPEEIQLESKKAQVEFYNGELIFANKACTEFQCGTIDQTQFNQVAEYIQSIDPYKPQQPKTVKEETPVKEEKKSEDGKVVEEPIVAKAMPMSFAAIPMDEVDGPMFKSRIVPEPIFDEEAAKAKRPAIFSRYVR